jgi:hypothetical protein
LEFAHSDAPYVDQEINALLLAKGYTKIEAVDRDYDYKPETWIDTISRFGSKFHVAVGRLVSLFHLSLLQGWYRANVLQIPQGHGPKIAG